MHMWKTMDKVDGLWPEGRGTERLVKGIHNNQMKRRSKQGLCIWRLLGPGILIKHHSWSVQWEFKMSSGLKATVIFHGLKTSQATGAEFLGSELAH